VGLLPCFDPPPPPIAFCHSTRGIAYSFIYTSWFRSAAVPFTMWPAGPPCCCLLILHGNAIHYSHPISIFGEAVIRFCVIVRPAVPLLCLILYFVWIILSGSRVMRVEQFDCQQISYECNPNVFSPDWRKF
jgi:hypothetical protein